MSEQPPTNPLSSALASGDDFVRNIMVTSDGNVPPTTVLIMTLVKYGGNGLYTYPVVWQKSIPFVPKVPTPWPIVYRNQFAFGRPKVEDNKIAGSLATVTINKGQSTELHTDGKGAYSFTTPVPAGEGFENMIVAQNDCPLLENITISVSNGLGFEPVEIWTSTGSGSELVSEFQPILYIRGWVDPKVSASAGQILPDDGPGDLLWSADPLSLKPTTALQLTYDITKLALVLKQTP
ncbi:hypothetical protein PIIN_05505 [Serendipita indica DSM 11827]|uniref:Uncharacterized protein n=1 Tax=Serendipita indica (strain DSM 11827) TaxID=1109443 RepID=G4TJS6_SERID|nr:hypothetical protein PIIN_05505 [Serendipita indica DSM 11827]